MNLRLLTPLVSFGAAWATKKSLNAMYAKRHEGAIPSKEDVDVPFTRVLGWALITAVVVALVDVTVQQGMARLAEHQQAELSA